MCIGIGLCQAIGLVNKFQLFRQNPQTHDSVWSAHTACHYLSESWCGVLIVISARNHQVCFLYTPVPLILLKKMTIITMASCVQQATSIHGHASIANGT